VDTRLRSWPRPSGRDLLAAAGWSASTRPSGCGSGWSRGFLSSRGAGSAGIETRKDDEATIAAIQFLDHPGTRFEVTAERAALAALGGGCQVPIGILCRAVTALSRALVLVFTSKSLDRGRSTDRQGGSCYSSRASRRYRSSRAGRLTAQKLIEAGAGPLLEAAGGRGFAVSALALAGGGCW